MSGNLVKHSLSVLFICSYDFFNDTSSGPDCVAANDRMISGQ